VQFYLILYFAQGVPSEIYSYGAQFLLILLGMFICIVIASELWIPILYNLKVVSVYEYFNLRYKSPVPRRIMSSIFIIKVRQSKMHFLKILRKALQKSKSQ
jgi:Na+/proline symporter